jgi:hypothetical protein
VESRVPDSRRSKRSPGGGKVEEGSDALFASPASREERFGAQSKTSKPIGSDRGAFIGSGLTHDDNGKEGTLPEEGRWLRPGRNP